MNSRFVPITTGFFSLLVAVFFIIYFESPWRWGFANLLLFFVTFPCLKTGFFATQDEVDKMTGVDKMEGSINPYQLVWELVLLCRFVVYGVTIYIAFLGFHYFSVPLIAVLLSLIKVLHPDRFNIIRMVKRDSIMRLLNSLIVFYILDLIIIGFIYGLTVVAQKYI